MARKINQTCSQDFLVYYNDRAGVKENTIKRPIAAYKFA